MQLPCSYRYNLCNRITKYLPFDSYRIQSWLIINVPIYRDVPVFLVVTVYHTKLACASVYSNIRQARQASDQGPRTALPIRLTPVAIPHIMPPQVSRSHPREKIAWIDRIWSQITSSVDDTFYPVLPSTWLSN